MQMLTELSVRKLSKLSAATALSLLLGISLHAQRLNIFPLQAMADQPFRIQVTGLKPGSRITLRATLVDGASKQWTSEASFIADKKGAVDVAEQAPISGSYKTVSDMGLIFSMLPVDQNVISYKAPPNYAAQEINIGLELEHETVATAKVKQIYMDEGVRVVDLSPPLYGTLFVPPGSGPFPALIMLNGSGGGAPKLQAALLASHGFAVLALAYFRYPGLPSLLENIPLEYFGDAISWLSQRPDIDPNKIGVIGTSRGGELALQLGSIYPQLHAVVAYVPSNVRVVACCGTTGDGGLSGHPAWILNGKPLPYSDTVPIQGQIQDPSTEIAVERTNGPILLISAGDDHIWPSRWMSDRIMQRLKRENFPFDYKHLTYDDVGHGVGRPQFIPTFAKPTPHPITGQLLQRGGTPEGYAASTVDVGPKVLAFLKANLTTK